MFKFGVKIVSNELNLAKISICTGFFSQRFRTGAKAKLLYSRFFLECSTKMFRSILPSYSHAVGHLRAVERMLGLFACILYVGSLPWNQS